MVFKEAEIEGDTREMAASTTFTLLRAYPFPTSRLKKATELLRVMEYVYFAVGPT